LGFAEVETLVFRTGAARVAVREPVKKMEQFLGSPQSVRISNRAIAVNRLIADFFDGPDFQENVFGEVVFERWLVD
jgi:hypothetical protein